MIDKSNGETVSEPILKVIVADDDVFINRLLCSTVEGMGYQTAGATTGKETIELARANENSLILLDFQLSDYTAIQVVEQLAKNKIERPFIIITGKGNEQIAVEMMKMGAIDYLVKDQHLADMIPQILTKAVNNMRNEAALKKAEERIRNSERKYRELFEKMYNGVGVFARSREDGSFSSVDFNESGAKILERSREELIGKNLTEIFPGCSEGALCSAFNSAYSSGRTEYAPVIVYKDKQIERWLTFAVSRLPSGDVMAVFEDKTKQMRSEHALLRSERRYRSVVDDAPAFIARFAPGGETTFVNETLAKYLGSKPKHLLGTNFFEFISEEDREPFGETLKGITKETPVAAAERRISAKSGETAWIKWIVRGIFDDDALTEIQAVGQDVTESLNAQRELAKSEERFKTASLLTSDLIYERNLKDGSVSLYLDKNSLERSEKADFPATLEEWRERAHPEDAEKMESALKRALEESSPVETEYRLRRPDGTYAYWRDKSVAVKDESGVPVKIIGAASDVTRRRDIEEALKNSEAKYRQIFDNAAIAIFRSRIEDGVVIECNEKFAEFFGYADKSDAAGKISMLQHYADLSKRETMLQACVEKDGVRDLETKFIKTDGTEAWGLLSARTLPGEKHLECAIVDITDRINMLDQLRVSEDLYRKLMSASPDVVVLIDKNGNVKYASNKTYHVFGIEDYQIQGTNIIKWISPEDRIRTLDKLKAAFDGDNLVQEEIALLRNNGEEFIGEINSSRIADAAGNTETVIAVIRDVTEKKRLRAEMKKNEEKYKLLFESASEGFMLLDDHAIVDCNARAGQIFDLSKSEMIGKFPWELSPPVQPDGRDSKAAGEKYIEAAYLVPQNFMWRHWTRDGSTIECNVSLSAITIDDKKFILVGVQDVTDRETALRELKASREHLSLITDSLPALIAHVDANLRYRFVNKAYAQMLGLPKERIVGSTIKELAGDAAFKAMFPYIMEVMSGKKAEYEYEFSNPDGETFELSSTMLPQLDERGAAIGFFVLSFNVTNEKKRQMELQNSQKLLSTTLDSMDDWIQVIDKDFRIVFMNKSLQTINEKLGFEGDLIGRALSEAYPLMSESMESEYRKVFQTGETISYDSETSVDEETLITRTEIIPVFIGDEVVRVIHLIKDITDWKLAEDELKTSQSLMVTTLNAMEEWIHVIDERRRIIFINRAFKEINRKLGVPPDALGQNVRDVFKILPQEAFDEYDRVFSSGQIISHEEIAYYENGKPVYTETYKLPIFDGEKVANVVTVIRDITKRKETEADLERLVRERTEELNAKKNELELANTVLKSQIKERVLAEENLKKQSEVEKAILASIPAGVFLKDMNKKYIEANRAFCEMLGKTPAEIIGKSAYDLFGAEEAAAFEANDDLAIKNDSPLLNVETKIYPKGEMMWISSSKIPFHDSAGNVVGVVGVIINMNETKKMEEFLRNAKDEADSANVAKSMFLANMSHEIRTPMNGVIGAARLLFDTELSDLQKEYVDQLVSSGEMLLSIINDILDLSKLEANKLEIEPVVFDLPDKIDKTLSLFGIKADEKGIELALSYDGFAPRKIIADDVRIGQVLINLVGNAVKFTSKGYIRVSVECVDVKANKDFLKITVADTGIGIPKEKYAHIFEQFTQADSSTTRQFGGTGLGLSICKRLVELMGGEINVESEVGNGSQFWFTIPLESPAVPEQSYINQIAPADLKEHRYLIIENNEVSRKILEDYFNAWGLKKDFARDPAAGLEMLFKAKEAGEPYRLVITNYQTPEINGAEFAAKVKSELDIQETGIVVLSTVSLKGRLRELIESGLLENVQKPIYPSKLIDAMRAVLSAPTEGQRRTVQRHRTDLKFPHLNVLVVEDHPTNQKVAGWMLAYYQVKMDIANNGLEAVKMVLEKPYDLVFMDVQMPVMDGYTATRKIREMENEKGLRPLPIIAMTANALKGDKEQCIEAGMNDYIPKPIRREELGEKLSLYCGDAQKTRERREGSEKGEKSEAGGRAAAQPDADFGNAQTFNYADALKRYDEDVDMLKEIVQSYLDDLPKHISAEAALESSDFTAISQQAHALKGGASYLSAERLRMTALELEKAGKSGNIETAKKEFDRLKEELETFKTVFKDGKWES